MPETIATLTSRLASLEATVEGLSNTTTSLSNSETSLAASIDTFYLLYSGALVFFMQAGFGVLEAGSVRTKNTRNILLKNLLDACVGAVIWLLWGHGTAYQSSDSGKNPFIGTPGKAMMAHGWAGRDESPSGADWVSWWFQYVFAAAAATIVSGAMAERAQLGAYLVYTTVITGLIYPVIVHWVWDPNGWASGSNPDAFLGGVVDFAGSGVVHMTGGVAAFWGAKIIGPRTGRFDANGTPVPIVGHSTVLQVLGTFCLWVGWLGFNPGSTLAISPDGSAQVAARSIVTTTLSGACAGLTVVIITKKLDHVWDVGALCNGILVGLVSITAGCATVYPWHAIIIGFVGGLAYLGGSRLELKLKIDDPLDAFAVHGCGGFWACIAVGLFSVPHYSWGAGGGLFFGEHKQFAAQLVTLIVEMSWTSVLSIMMFSSLKLTGILRVSLEVESKGMDVSKHGGTAYTYGDAHSHSSSSTPHLQSANVARKIAPEPKDTSAFNESNVQAITPVEPA